MNVSRSAAGSGDATSVAGDAWADAATAMALFAIDPFALGGIVLRSRPGPHRDRACAWARILLPAEAPTLRLPLHVTDDRLLGGLSLAETLRTGRPVTERGLLARANGGAVIVAMAERLAPHVTSHLCAALDRGELTVERDGTSEIVAARLGVVALDESLDGEERAPVALRERLAFDVDLTTISPRASTTRDEPSPDRVAEARARLTDITLAEDIVVALCEAAIALGIASLRAPLLAAAAARAHAALEGRSRVTDEDAAVAARLVLAPRATRLPPTNAEESSPADAEENDPQRDEKPNDEASDADASGGDDGPAKSPPDDVVLAAAKSAIPPGLLDGISRPVRERTRARHPVRSAGRAGAARLSSDGGRPAGTAPMRVLTERLNLVETLRAAAPWQLLRRAEHAERAELAGEAAETQVAARRIHVRKSDLRATRFQQRTETSVIFSVDASGSAALQRLAEAKGAVEQVLGDCYVRRDHVALVAFRDTGATVLLPPTRSLARVKRCLADLAGGGATPLASGIDAAMVLADDALRRGRTPLVVVMTDGRANVARDGREGAAVAAEDALSSARAVREAGVRALFLDTAPRPRLQAQSLAIEMGARYVPLPYVDAVAVSRHVQALERAGATVTAPTRGRGT